MAEMHGIWDDVESPLSLDLLLPTLMEQSFPSSKDVVSG